MTGRQPPVRLPVDSEKGPAPPSRPPDPSTRHRLSAATAPEASASLARRADKAGPPPMVPTPLAASVLARAGRPIPRYGTAEWDALPEDDLRRVAAILVAAECWRDYTSPHRVAADVREQLLEDDALILARLRATSADVHAGLGLPRAGWADVPSHAELLKRRAS